MYSSSPYLWPRFPLLCILNIQQPRVSSDHTSHTFCSFYCCGLKTVPFLLFVVGWSFFSLLHPLLAVFHTASAFNQDVSKWNTGAVTRMDWSKCTLSPSLWPRLPSLCLLNLRQLAFHRITLLTRFVVCFCVFETVPFFVVCGGLVFLFLCRTLSCSVLSSI